MSRFVAGLDAGEVQVQACGQCRKRQAPESHVCRRCGHAQLSWLAVEDPGIVEAVTTIYRGADARFAALAPFSIAIVRFDDGLRLMGHVAHGTVIGLRVKASVADVLGQPMLRFESVS